MNKQTTNLQMAKDTLADAQRVAQDCHAKVLSAIAESDALAAKITAIEASLTAANQAHVAELSKAALGEPHDSKGAEDRVNAANSAATELPALRKQLEVADAVRVTLSARLAAANIVVADAVQNVEEEINSALQQRLKDVSASAKNLVDQMESVGIETTALRSSLMKRGQIVIIEPVDLWRVESLDMKKVELKRRALQAEYGLD
jgi:hypothetical protein